jgi:phosphatidylserine/phosphatidylglycerophosphate/cardiolipin synthase-like enzyme
MIVVDGDAAAALGDLARERWHRATGERLAPGPAPADRWPRGLAPDFEDVEVAIARTAAPFDGRPGVREVEALYLDSIRAARRTIYLENQYLTSPRIADALAARLAEPDGPEVVIVTPHAYRHWHEQATMGALRARVLERVRAADRFGRLRVCYPVVPDLGDGAIKVHSKLAVIDEWFLRVGSANLANRSMALDSECDVAVEAENDERRRRAIRDVRDRLLAEHLGVAVATVAAVVAETGSLVAAIDRLAKGPRHLEPLDDVPPAWLARLLAPQVFADPVHPLDRGSLVESLVPEIRVAGWQPIARTLLFLAAAAVLSLIAPSTLPSLWRK